MERVEIKDVRLPPSLTRAMAAEAEAAREAKAKVIIVYDFIVFRFVVFLGILTILFQIIAAEGEMNASKNLKEAADTIASSPAALQLR